MQIGGKGIENLLLITMYAKDTIRINHPNESVTSSFKC